MPSRLHYLVNDRSTHQRNWARIAGLPGAPKPVRAPRLSGSVSGALLARCGRGAALDLRSGAQHKARTPLDEWRSPAWRWSMNLRSLNCRTTRCAQFAFCDDKTNSVVSLFLYLGDEEEEGRGYDGVMSNHGALAIRLARMEDASTLASAERAIAAEPGFLASRPDELTYEKTARAIAKLTADECGCFLVAETAGTVIAHGLLAPLPLAATRHVVHLTLAVHPTWQGMGVGRELLRSLIQWAIATPAIEKIELHVRSSNERAQALYRKAGFTEMGRWRRRIKIGPGAYIDDVAMEMFVD